MLELDDVAEVVAEAIKEATAPLIARIAELEARAPEKGERGEPGEVDMDAVRSMIAEQVAAIELPEPVPGPKGDRGDAGEKGDQGERGADGKDGVGLTGMMINRDGEGVATLSDGTLVNLGQLVGRDGRDGTDGRDGAPGERGERGDAGRDGRDGLDVENIEVTQDGATVELKFTVGETQSIFELEMPKARDGVDGRDGKDAYPGEAKGLYDPNAKYLKLDCVSFNGCEWRAKRDDPGDLPGDGWMLSAQKGKPGQRGERGATGRDGVTPVAQYLRGNELVTTLSDGAEITADISALRGEE